jgi:hypothetical protein
MHACMHVKKELYFSVQIPSSSGRAGLYPDAEDALLCPPVVDASPQASTLCILAAQVACACVCVCTYVFVYTSFVCVRM